MFNSSASPAIAKLPRSVYQDIFAFPPNRDTQGGTAYFVVESSGNILVDSPAWDEPNLTFIQQQGGIRWLFLTHRGNIGRAKAIQSSTGCEVVIQEQEAYLLPGVPLTPFAQEFTLSPSTRALWTPGHSPGSACLYHSAHGGILFTGRHLLPNAQGNPTPLRLPKTFHWGRQLKHTQRLLTEFTPDTLHTICPGANTGFLRGERAIVAAYEKLAALDWERLERDEG